MVYFGEKLTSVTKVIFLSCQQAMIWRQMNHGSSMNPLYLLWLTGTTTSDKDPELLYVRFLKNGVPVNEYAAVGEMENAHGLPLGGNLLLSIITSIFAGIRSAKLTSDREQPTLTSPSLRNRH